MPSTAATVAGSIMRRLGIVRGEIRGEHIDGILAGLKRVFPAIDRSGGEGVFAGLPLEAPAGSEPLWGVIVETREHQALPTVVRNVVACCGIPVQIFHSQENLGFIHASSIAEFIASGQVSLTPLNVPGHFTQSMYNQLLLSRRFWAQIFGRRKILVFQTDSMCCPASGYSVDDFLAFDYIGSRWDRERPVGLVIDGGSGGFSLRDWSHSVACLERFNPERWPGGEDGYFAFHLDLLGATVASMAEAARFSTQDSFEQRSFGCHQIGRLGKEDLAAFFAYCGEAREIFPHIGEPASPAPGSGGRRALPSESSSFTHRKRKPPYPASSSHLDLSLEIGTPMFISDEYKLMYYEVPRTGSHSITRVLSELDPESPTVAERDLHGAGFGYHHLNKKALADPEYRLVATHRNPYDRLWSFWKHRRQHGNPEAFKTISWVDYVDWVCNPDSENVVEGASADVPITEMLDLERVDYWLDFHQLASSWAAVSQSLGLPLIALQTLNSSPDHGRMQSAYSRATGSRVAQRFARDFEYFGYDPDSWRAGVPVASR